MENLANVKLMARLHLLERGGGIRRRVAINQDMVGGAEKNEIVVTLPLILPLGGIETRSTGGVGFDVCDFGNGAP